MIGGALWLRPDFRARWPWREPGGRRRVGGCGLQGSEKGAGEGGGDGGHGSAERGASGGVVEGGWVSGVRSAG